MEQSQPSHPQLSKPQQSQSSSDNQAEPQLPTSLQVQNKKPLPSIQHEQDENSFFFTGVNVQGKYKQRKPEPQLQKQNQQPVESQTSQISTKEVNPLEQVKLLLQKFNKYDHKLVGMISLQNAKSIFQEMQIDITNFNTVSDISIMTKKEHCTFDEFLAMLNEFQERRFEVNETKLFVKRQFKTDPRLIAFIRLLDEYRRKNQLGGEYKEAKSAKTKIQQLKQKQAVRKQATLRIIHTQQIASLQQLQRKQFQQFSDSWDKYMQDYQKAALQSLDSLKHKHIRQLEDYDKKIRSQSPKIYYSKQVLELRTKQKNLVKLQQYEQAAKVRIKIDDLQQVEQERYQIDVAVSIQNKINNFRTKQTSALNALLKKIQKDRNQQLKTRQLDSERLIVKNRNMRNQLIHRHQDEIKRAIESLKDLMVDQGPRGERGENKRKSTQLVFK